MPPNFILGILYNYIIYCWISPVYRKPSRVNQVICDYGKGPSSGKVCIVDVDHNMGPCVPGNSYGYLQSKPCVFIKLNKVKFYKKKKDYIIWDDYYLNKEQNKTYRYVNKYHTHLDPRRLGFDFRAGYDNEVLGLVFTEPTQHSA